MRNQILFSLRRQATTPWLVVSLVLFAGVWAFGQNLLKNGDFESPLTTNDWIVQFSAPGIPSSNALSSAGNFAIADRSTEGSRVAGGYGAHFRPRTDWSTRAYFSQTVTGLDTGATYRLSGYMRCYQSNNNVLGFIEVVGGSGDAVGDGRFTLRTPRGLTNRPPTQYFLDQTPDLNGNIEVRLRFVKTATPPGAISYPEFVKYSVYYDDFSLTRLTP
jgi:hypothetical protein